MIVMIIIFSVIIAIVAFLLIFSSTKSNNSNERTREGYTYIPSQEYAGLVGESETNRYLSRLLRPDEYLLRNLLIPFNNGGSAEIDCVLITRKGIFCIETKKWAGYIKGTDDSEYWTQTYEDPNRTPKKNKNPVKQNEAHCRALGRVLNHRYGIANVVIFVDLKAFGGIYSTHAYTLLQFERSYDSLDDDLLTVEEIKQLYQKLTKYKATQEQMRKHNEEVR